MDKEAAKDICDHGWTCELVDRNINKFAGLFFGLGFFSCVACLIVAWSAYRWWVG